MKNELSTDPYKGTRDFYPEDMAVQRYIFDTWAKTAELHGFERYDASILEPSELYKSKGAENEEMVNEQTYTFIDRGDREVTLRPEMTPTVARMIAGKRRELSFPVRWYSIPNLFRYERPQKGRLREHWQLNCDLFGSTDVSADIEIIALAYKVLTAFGATPDMFEIQINDRDEMNRLYTSIGVSDPDTIRQITRLTDRKKKISREEYQKELTLIVGEEGVASRILEIIESPVTDHPLTDALRQLGIQNSTINRTISRGFDYYTSTVFEVFERDAEGNPTGRSLIGGGRYDNLTGLFGGDPIPGIGFGMGDVTMRDFLLSHDLLPESIKSTGTTVAVVPTDTTLNLQSLGIAETFRNFGITTSVDTSDRKLGKKISLAGERGSTYIVVVGSNEIQTNHFTLKNLSTQEERSGTPEELASQA
jgi:histidyl-tRNA synthetase